MPFWPPLPSDDREPDDLRPDEDFPAEDVDREELRGDLAAEVLAVLNDVVLDAGFDEPERPDLAPLVLLPLADVFDRADVVPRDEDDLELPLFDEDRELPPLEPPLVLRDDPLRPPLLLRDEELRPLLLLREDPLLLEPVLREDVLRPPVELLRADDPPLDERLLLPLPLRDDALRPLLLLPLLRPPLALFLDDDEELPDARLLLVAAAPFLPAALFCAVEPPREELLRDDEPDPLRDDPPVERELDADFLAPPLDDLELDDLDDPPLEDLELEPDDFLAPPPEDDRDEDELFFEPPLLLELDDEREPLDFLVVAMQIIPPIIFGMFLHEQHRAKFVPLAVLYQVKTAWK